jgi:hypothetical protein
MDALAELQFDNRFAAQLPADPEPANFRRQVADACYSRVAPTQVARPRLVAWSREAAELGPVRELLDGSGYSTHLLRRVDEAGDLWHRLLVGPYETRLDAEGAAVELQREREIDAWVHEEGDETMRRSP